MEQSFVKVCFLFTVHLIIGVTNFSIDVGQLFLRRLKRQLLFQGHLYHYLLHNLSLFMILKVRVTYCIIIDKMYSGCILMGSIFL